MPETLRLAAATCWCLLLASPPSAAQQQFGVQALSGSVRDPNGLCAADFDGDGAIELAVAAVNQSVYGHVAIQKRMPSGSWAQVAVVSTGRVAGMAFAELTGDARPELLVAHAVAFGTAFEVWSFDAGLQRTVLFASPAIYGQLVWMRGDLDAEPDLFASTAAQVQFVRNLGGGTFAPPVATALPPNTLAAVVADFDGDGIADVASLVGSFPRTVVVLLGNGSGGFGGPVVTAVPSPFPFDALATADFDGDGRTDLVLQSSVLLASGGGAFTVVPQALPLAIYRAAGDCDGDGAPDLVAMNMSTLTLELLLQRSGMTFVQSGASLPTPGNTGGMLPFVLDVDHDGLTDIVGLYGFGQYQALGSIYTRLPPHAPPHVQPYGIGTAGCMGLPGLTANIDPAYGAQGFRLIANGAPRGSPGILAWQMTTAMLPAPHDPFGVGIRLYLTLPAVVAPFAADQQGHASLPCPIPGAGPLTFQCQAAWLAPHGDGACSASPFGLVTSQALAITPH